MRVSFFLLLGLWAQGCSSGDALTHELWPDFSYERAELEAVPLDAAWEFAEGDSMESLNSFMPPEEWVPIQIPHRTLPSDHSFYYRTVLRPHGNMLIDVNADDGAQVFVDGELLRRVHDTMFELPASEIKDTLLIRVLNNAMWGGLREVNVIRNWKPATVSGRLLVPPLLIKRDGQLLVLWEPADGLQSYIEVLTPGSDAFKAVSKNGFEGVYIAEIPADANAYRLFLEGEYTRSIPVKNSVDENVTFSIWADSQGGWETFRRISMQMLSLEPDFSIGIGDLVAEGADRNQWRSMLNATFPASSEIPFYLIPGNHDYDGYYDDLKSANYHRYYPLPDNISWFSWTEGPAAFVALDANRTFPVGISGSQKQWLIDVLTSDQWLQAKWKFLLIHHPPYSQGWPGYSGDLFVRDLTDSLAAAGLIDVVVSGHSHNYERLLSNNVLYIVSGGAGGSLEPEENSPEPQMDVVESVHHFGLFTVSSSELDFRALDLEGRTIDSLHLSKVGGDEK